MMSGVPLETCWAFNKLWNNKFYYKLLLVVISTESYYDARIHEYQKVLYLFPIRPLHGLSKFARSQRVRFVLFVFFSPWERNTNSVWQKTNWRWYKYVLSQLCTEEQKIHCSLLSSYWRMNNLWRLDEAWDISENIGVRLYSETYFL
jgi:hypothetical protein